MEKFILLDPVEKSLIWGKESWVIAAHENGDGVIRNGLWKGKTLSWLWKNHREYFGNMKGNRFPLLIKEISAQADLSIQVHPDNEYARKYENGASGKSECWYILEAKEGASLIMGHHARNRSEAEAYVRKGQWKDFLNEVSVKAGNFFQIDAGCLHSIKGGIRLLEIQQNSDITYRLYDYGRLDKDGKPRNLHIEKSLDVLSYTPKPAFPLSPKQLVSGTETLLIRNSFYQVVKVDLTEGSYLLPSEVPFLCVNLLHGSGVLDTFSFSSPANLIIPYHEEPLTIQGTFSMILSFPRCDC